MDILSRLCEEADISPYKVCEKIGLNRSAVAKWKKGAIPSGATLNALAQLFHVSVDYLLGNEQKKSPALVKKDERDIKIKIDSLLKTLLQQKELMFDGDPLTPEARESIRSALELGMAAAANKQK